MELGEPDASGRRKPIEKPGTEFVLDVDTVIIAIGTSPNPLIKMTTEGLKTNDHGGIIIDEETGATSREGVFAGGDAVTGAATVILAMGAGRKQPPESINLSEKRSHNHSSPFTVLRNIKMQLLWKAAFYFAFWQIFCD